MKFNKYYSIDNYDPKSITSILNYAKSLEGSTLGEKCNPDIKEGNLSGKGNFGQYLEKYYFGFNPNNNPEPDFSYVGVELKTGAIKRTTKVRLFFFGLQINLVIKNNCIFT